MNGDSFQKVKQRFKDQSMVFNGGYSVKFVFEIGL